MMIKLSGTILIKIYDFTKLLPFSENLTMQPQVSNIPTVLVCSSMDAGLDLCFWGFSLIAH